ncbi:MAG: hypothetical protein ABI946_04900 [Chthoniobacterales bacterium]
MIAGLSLFLVAGTGLMLLAERGGRASGILEAGAVSFFLGTGLISLLLWICGAFLSGAALQYFVTVIAVGLGMWGVAVARKRRLRLRLSLPRNALEWILVGAIALEFVLAFHASFSRALG